MPEPSALSKLSFPTHHRINLWCGNFRGVLPVRGWIDPWVDEKKLLPGQDWRTKIEEAVETSDIVIICLSSNSVSKEGYVQKELRYAREIALEKLEESIFLIPLRLDECDVPRGLRFYQWVDYFGDKKDESYSALIESLKLRYEQKLKLEEAERVRKEKLEREAAEKTERERIEHESQEKAAREQEKRELAEKAKREAAEKLAQDNRVSHNEIERIRHEIIESQSAQKAPSTKTLYVPSLKRQFFLRIVGFAGIAIALIIWISSLGAHAIATPQIPQATFTAQSPTSAEATVTSLQNSLTKVFGPANGVLPHSPNDKINSGIYQGMSFISSGVTLKNFIVELLIENPGSKDMYYGVVFRETKDNALYLFLNSNGNWNLANITGNFMDTRGGSGTLNNFNLSPGSLNKIRLVVYENSALFFVNDDFVSTLNVFGNKLQGDVRLFISDPATEVHRIAYENFTIWSIGSLSP